jgi:methionine sulfoxide reductase heme-binding subunit
MMNRKALLTLKALVWIACLFPFSWLVYAAFTNTLGADQTATITFTTGKTTLWLLTITLAITPLRKLSAKLSWLIRFRRLLGLFAFFYGSLHLLTYVGLYAGFDVSTMVDDITRRRFIIAGLTAWLLMLPLAATSTNWAIRKLGGKKWTWLHKLVYLAAIAGVVHYWWGVKPGVQTPMLVTVVLTVLFVARPMISWWKMRAAN